MKINLADARRACAEHNGKQRRPCATHGSVRPRDQAGGQAEVDATRRFDCRNESMTAICLICGDPETGEIFASDSGVPLHRESLHKLHEEGLMAKAKKPKNQRLADVATKEPAEGMGQAQPIDAELSGLIENYIEARDERMEATEGEVEARKAVVEKMHALAITHYVDHDAEVEATIAVVDEKLKAKRLKAETEESE